MILSPRALKSLNNIDKIQPRIMVPLFNVNPETIIIFSYSPTHDSNETDLDTFYNKLSLFIKSLNTRFSSSKETWMHK